jgi:xanthine dehydrogenase large subunit
VQNIRRSKAVGEPPLMLAISAWAAVKNALSYARSEAANRLSLPATGEEILRCLTPEPEATPHSSPKDAAKSFQANA